MLVEGADKDNRTGDDARESDIPAAITDTGCERQLNEDRYAVIESHSGLAWLVCDGMGGVTGGELAAQLAIDAIRRDLENLPPRSSDVALKGAILEANRIIVLRRQNRAFAGMGTTIVSAIFNGPELVLASVGDSRGYLIRDGAIQQLTTDHTFVQELVDKGQIRPEDALSHPQAHILTRCIGSEPGLDVETRKYWIWQVPDTEPTDYLLLCTDGLYSLVSEGEMANIIASNTPQRACVQLVETAKARGGYDNITCAIIPLGGQLKSEPPIGYKSPPVAARNRAAPKKPKIQPASWGKLLVMVAVLSVLAMLVTIVATASYYLR
ncbi:MAG: protein phosphatase 2C domain-containing protein [Deltaproteobacteria bacterium]|nr:protein phosphatase 2C domain-containing protein [Deltaproteobacteria bacterium]